MKRIVVGAHPIGTWAVSSDIVGAIDHKKITSKPMRMENGRPRHHRSPCQRHAGCWIVRRRPRQNSKSCLYLAPELPPWAAANEWQTQRRRADACEYGSEPERGVAPMPRGEPAQTPWRGAETAPGRHRSSRNAEPRGKPTLLTTQSHAVYDDSSTP